MGREQCMGGVRRNPLWVSRNLGEGREEPNVGK